MGSKQKNEQYKLSDLKHLPCQDDEKASSDNKKTSSMRRVNTGITDESLYLAMAMWMEMFPELSSDLITESQTADQSKDLYRKIGCVLVQQNGRLVSVDHSRDGVHGLARLLVKHRDKTTGCSVFVSRKPCTYCTKLLMKSGVTAVSYLPAEPECYRSKDENRVDTLFDVGGVSKTVFVPRIKVELAKVIEEELVASGASFDDVQECTRNVFRRFWSEERVRHEGIDSIEQTCSELNSLVKWMAQIHLSFDRLKFRCFGGNEKVCLKSLESTIGRFDPENNDYQEKIAKHLLGLATMTVQGTVEPKTGVGSVIMKQNDVIAVGWNDFPSKIIEEDFHDASDLDRDKKYAFFVHAEQNALLRCNATDVSGGIIFVTKTPCHECTPLVKVSGIGTVVLATPLQPIKEKYRLNYEVFREEVAKGTFLCYEMIPIQK